MKIQHRQNLGWRPSDEKQKEQINKLQVDTRTQDGKPMEQRMNIRWCPKDEKQISLD